MLALNDYWEDYPPVHETFATFVGVKRSSPRRTTDVASAAARDHDGELATDMAACGIMFGPGLL